MLSDMCQRLLLSGTHTNTDGGVSLGADGAHSILMSRLQVH